MKNNTWLIGGIIAVVAAILVGIIFLNPSKSSSTQSLGYSSSKNPTPEPEASHVVIRQNPSDNTPVEDLEIDKTKSYTATLNTTEGPIVITLNADKTPITVNNFVTLAKKNFYNNTIFHRVIKGFMIQGGDPTGTGTGGPGYKFNDEPFEGDYTRGTVAMANSGPNTNGSQFFIMHADMNLPKNYVIFGKVTQGLDTVDKIAEAPVRDSVSGEMSDPVTPVKITSVEITEQ